MARLLQFALPNEPSGDPQPQLDEAIRLARLATHDHDGERPLYIAMCGKLFCNGDDPSQRLEFWLKFFSGLVEECLDGNAHRLFIPCQRTFTEQCEAIYEKLYGDKSNELEDGLFVHNLNHVTCVCLDFDPAPDKAIIERVRQRLEKDARIYTDYTPSFLLATRSPRIAPNMPIKDVAKSRDEYFPMFDAVLYADIESGATFPEPAIQKSIVCGLGVGPFERGCAQLLELPPPWRWPSASDRHITLSTHSELRHEFQDGGVTIPVRRNTPERIVRLDASSEREWDDGARVTLVECWERAAELIEGLDGDGGIHARIASPSCLWRYVIDEWPKCVRDLEDLKYPKRVRATGVTLLPIDMREYFDGTVVNFGGIRDQVSRQTICQMRGCSLKLSERTVLVLRNWGSLEFALATRSRGEIGGSIAREGAMPQGSPVADLSPVGVIRHNLLEWLVQGPTGFPSEVLLLYGYAEARAAQSYLGSSRSGRWGSLLEVALERHRNDMRRVISTRDVVDWYLRSIPLDDFPRTLEFADPEVARETFRLVGERFRTGVRENNWVVPIQTACRELRDWFEQLPDHADFVDRIAKEIEFEIMGAEERLGYHVETEGVAVPSELMAQLAELVSKKWKDGIGEGVPIEGEDLLDERAVPGLTPSQILDDLRQIGLVSEKDGSYTLHWSIALLAYRSRPKSPLYGDKETP